MGTETGCIEEKVWDSVGKSLTRHVSEHLSSSSQVTEAGNCYKFKASLLYINKS